MGEAAKGNPQVTVLDTFTLFANPQGEAKQEEFPDLFHPNAAGYAKWKAGLWPLFATFGFVDTTPDNFTPEPGFEMLFNGRDLTGWGMMVSTPDEVRSSNNNPNLAWPIVTTAVELRRQNAIGRRPLCRQERPADCDHAHRGPANSKAVDDERVFRRLHHEARIPRNAERRQRRVLAQQAAAMPRLPAGRSL